MKSYLYLFLFLCVATVSSAQSLVWAGQFSSDQELSLTDMVIDPSSNIYLTGNFNGSADFNPGAPVTELTGKSFIVKLNQSGALIWARTFNGSSLDAVAIDESQNVFLAFNLQDSLDVDPGMDEEIITALGPTDMVFVKLNFLGNFEWARHLEGTDSKRVLDITIDGFDNLVATGGFHGTLDFDPGTAMEELTSDGGEDIFVLKLTNEGDFNLARRIGGPGDDYALRVATDLNSGMHLYGEFTGTVDFNPGLDFVNVTAEGNTDLFYLTLQSFGGLNNVSSFGGLGELTPEAMRLDDAGFAYFTGSFSGTADFETESGSFNLTAAGNEDAFLTVLFDDDGEFVWAGHQGAPGGSASALAVAKAEFDSEIITTGYFSGSADFDPSNGDFFLSTESGMDQDMYISQFDEFQYRFECAVPIGSGASTQIGQHVEINQNGFIFVAGLFEGTVDFGLGGGNGVLTNVGQTFPDNDDQADIFIARYFPTNNCPITDVEDPIIGLGVTTFPNPTNGPWSVELDQVYPTINLKVLDLTGRALLEQNYQTVERIDLALDLPQGLYFVELSSLEERITLKLIME